MDVNLFKSELSNLSSEEFIDKYLLNDDPGIIATRADLEILVDIFKKNFSLDSNVVVKAYVVGSAKFGFSFLEKKVDGVVKPAYREYEPGVSDLDVALISNNIYSRLWKDFSISSIKAYPKVPEIKDFMFHGWIRPDKFPVKHTMLTQAYSAAFNQARQHNSFRYKNLRIGLYMSESFLRTYQTVGLNIAKDEL